MFGPSLATLSRDGQPNWEMGQEGRNCIVGVRRFTEERRMGLETNDLRVKGHDIEN